jgi:glycosyltransferase involved in cell wall biosynthesis
MTMPRNGPTPAERTRVLHVIDSLEPGGAERVMFDLVTGTDPKRYDVRVCCLKECREEPIARRLTQQGYPIYFLTRREGVDWSLVGKIHRIIRSERIDLVHGHMDGEFYGHLAALGTRAAIVTTVHGVFHHGIVRRLIPAVAGIVKKNARVAVSRSLGRRYRSGHLIYNGVEIPPERAASSIPVRDVTRNPGDVVIGIVARLSAVKNHRNFLRAASLVSEKSERARFLVVGSGPLEAELKRCAEELGLSGRIVFTGFRENAAEILGSIDISVLSSDSEGTPVVVLESMAAGTPIVATNVGGIPELVEDGVTGLLVPPGDSSKLAEALLRLIEDADLRTAMGKRARERAETRFSKEIMVKRYEELYESLLRRRR